MDAAAVGPAAGDDTAAGNPPRAAARNTLSRHADVETVAVDEPHTLEREMRVA